MYGPLERLAKTYASRRDAYVNWLSGIGTSRDRTTGGQYLASGTLDPNTLTALFRDNDLAKKIVSLLPDECHRKGYELGDPALSVACTRLRLNDRLLEAHRWARLYGGALLYAVTDDSSDVVLPRDPKAHVLDFEVWDRRRIQIRKYYDNPKRPNFGKPEIYYIQPFVGFTAQMPIEVHASRVVHFGGVVTDPYTILENAGWEDSVLQACEPIIRAFSEADGATGLMLSEASQAVFKLNGLLEALASGQSAAMQTRLQLLDISRSVARAVMLDASKESGESFERSQVTFSGVSDVIRTKMQRLAAASGIPISKLFSQTPSGLGTDTDNETRDWYDSVASHQRNYLEPRIREALEIIRVGSGETPILWRSLYQQAPKEAADTHLAQANADAVYLDRGVVTEQEIALSRFRPSGWSGETRLQPGARPTVTPSLPPAPPEKPKAGPVANAPAPVASPPAPDPLAKK